MRGLSFSSRDVAARIHAFATRSREDEPMRTKIVSAFVALYALAGSASAELPRHGRYDCGLGGLGVCSEGPEALCLGNRIRRGRPTIFLRVDFDRDHADLNGIDGRILRDAAPRADRILWELSLLGSPEIATGVLNGTTFVHLRFENSTATFPCRPAR
jgi:hypothetical protein